LSEAMLIFIQPVHQLTSNDDRMQKRRC